LAKLRIITSKKAGTLCAPLPYQNIDCVSINRGQTCVSRGLPAYSLCSYMHQGPYTTPSVSFFSLWTSSSSSLTLAMVGLMSLIRWVESRSFSIGQGHVTFMVTPSLDSIKI